MSATEPVPAARSWSLWLICSLLVLRLVIAPWGDVLIFNDTLDYMRQAELPIVDLFTGPFPGIQWPRPASFPLVLKLLGATRPDDLVTRKAVLVFNVLLSTATVGLAALAGRRVFAGEPARAGWAVFVFAISLTEFVYPWELAALSETPAADSLLLIAAGLAALSSPPQLRPAVLLALLVLSAFIGHLRESLILIPPALLVALCLLRRMERPRSERRVSSVAFAGCVGVIIAVTLAMYLQMGQRPGKSAVHLGNFVSMRALRDAGAREALVRELAPPASVLAARGIPYWSWAMDEQGRSWMREYTMRRHLLFLARHPAQAFDLFRQTSLALVSRIGTEEQYRWYWSARNKLPDTILLGMSYFATRLVSAPVLLVRSLDLDLCLFLPVVLLVVFATADARLGRMAIFPLLAFLGLVIYSQYLATALFEGTEDYRVAVSGSEALICFYWLSGASAVAMWRARRRRRVVVGAPEE